MLKALHETVNVQFEVDGVMQTLEEMLMPDDNGLPRFWQVPRISIVTDVAEHVASGNERDLVAGNLLVSLGVKGANVHIGTVLFVCLKRRAAARWMLDVFRTTKNKFNTCG